MKSNTAKIFILSGFLIFFHCISFAKSKIYSTEQVNSGNSRYEAVEPLTNYFVTRIQKDANKGNTVFGGMITSTHRYINHEYLNYLHKDAITGGLDFSHYWKDKTDYLSEAQTFSINSNIIDIHPYNIFLVKVSYMLNR